MGRSLSPVQNLRTINFAPCYSGALWKKETGDIVLLSVVSHLPPRNVGLRSSLFRDFTRSRLVVCDRCFVTTAYRSILQWSRSPRRMHCFEGFQSSPACPSNKSRVNIKNSMEKP